nr:M28 family peptidase [Candidatus Palauibacterales bacterium]
MTWPRPPALLRRAVLLLASATVPALAFSACGEADRPELRGFTPDGAAEQRTVETRLLGSFSADTMSAHHEHMTAEPHHAASEANRRYAEYYADVLRSYGFDDVRLIEYEALIPRPTARQVTLLAPERQDLSLEEPSFDEDPSSSAEDVLTPYNAYSGDGDVTAEVVYVNYGLPRDYEVLDSLGVSVEGKIALARYGMSWRGIKPRLAARHGAVGTILYSDPEDDGYVEGDTLPVGKWRPSRGVQSGSVMDMPTYPGDPQTPGRPSVRGAERIPRAEAETILDIPVLPISYGNAEHILRHLEGPVGPDEWQGGLDLEYRAGPGATRVRLRVESDWSVRPFVNVIAVLRGSEEPEKMVMAGAHRDAWTFGGRDPISGAVSLLEVGRRLGQLASEGLRPRRSVALASWGAEEYGLIGSTEYGEHFADSLQGRLVAYLNRESYTAGDFEAGGVHSLEPFVNGIARTVQMPDTA